MLDDLRNEAYGGALGASAGRNPKRRRAIGLPAAVFFRESQSGGAGLVLADLLRHPLIDNVLEPIKPMPQFHRHWEATLGEVAIDTSPTASANLGPKLLHREVLHIIPLHDCSDGMRMRHAFS